MRRLLPLLCLLSSCASAPREPFHPSRTAILGEEFTLELDELISLTGTPYLLTFSQVQEDSRCPAGVSCVWEGNARVAIFVSDFSKTLPAGPNSVEIGGFIAYLNTNPRIPTEGGDGELILELRRLAPERQPGAQTVGYTATLVARKK